MSTAPHTTSKFAQNKTEILSGLTVALALVPEAIAFAFIAGVEPLVGLYAAFIVGLITAIFGGRPAMISGATGALAVVMVSLVMQYGVEYLFATVVLMGILQMGAGLLKLGKLIKMVPYPVMLGFVNGLAIVIFLAQFGQFKNTEGQWLSTDTIMTMVIIIIATMAIIYLFPLITKKVPAALVGIVVVTIAVSVFGIDTVKVGDLADISGGLPSFHVPDVGFSWEMLGIIFPYAIILAAIGLIESLLTLTLIDEMTETRGQNNRECIAQGAANTVTGFFGGMGGCAMIGQSMINVNSGGRKRMSGIAASLFLLSFILFASGLISMIPIAVLIGVMFVVVIATFEWSSLRLLRKIPLSDTLVIIVVSVTTVFTDLAIAVIVGVIMSALVFAYNSAKNIHIESDGDTEHKIYTLHGQLFFASSGDFKELFSPSDDPADITIDFKHSRVWDHSAIDAINSVADKYRKLGKRLHLRHLSADCKKLMHKASDIVESHPDEDPHYRVVVDNKRESSIVDSSEKNRG